MLCAAPDVHRLRGTEATEDTRHGGIDVLARRPGSMAGSLCPDPHLYSFDTIVQNEVLLLMYISRLAYVQVELLVHEAPRGGSPQAVPMTRGELGVWRAEGPAAWLGRYYTYRVTVYCPWTQRIEARAAAQCRACCTSLLLVDAVGFASTACVQLLHMCIGSHGQGYCQHNERCSIVTSLPINNNVPCKLLSALNRSARRQIRIPSPSPRMAPARSLRRWTPLSCGQTAGTAMRRRGWRP